MRMNELTAPSLAALSHHGSSDQRKASGQIPSSICFLFNLRLLSTETFIASEHLFRAKRLGSRRKSALKNETDTSHFIFMMRFNFIYDVSAGCNYTDGHTLKQNTSQ